MKKFILAFALLIGVASFYNNNTASAQTINISINLGSQPAWGPTGYDYAGFYYFPEINCYYDVNMGTFYYVDRGYWVSARYLPSAYRNYDLYRLYKVVLNVRNPWRYNYMHHRDYDRYCGYNHRQVVIRDSRDYRYNDSRRNNVRWYSSTRYSVNRHDDRYSYNNKRNDNSNRRPEYNNNNRYSNNQASRPSYNSQDKNNSRPNTDRYQSENRSRDNKEYTNNRGQNNNVRKQESRPSVTSRESNSTSRKQSVDRSTQRNNSDRSSSKGSDFRLASNDRAGRSR